MAVTKRVRYEVLRRDNHACRYCGACAPGAKLTIDHVIPVALGGSDDPSNLVAACADCNAGKTSSSPDAALVADVATEDMRWADAMQRAFAHWRENEEEGQETVELFGDLWRGWGWDDADGKRHSVPLPNDWASTIARWLSVGFTLDDLNELIPRAMKKKGVPADERFRYYCGVVWRTLDQIQADAKAVVAAEAEWDAHAEIMRRAEYPARARLALQPFVDAWCTGKWGG